MSESSAHTRPLLWANQQLLLYHGTIDRSAEEIAKNGIRVGAGRAYRDFGPGFYMTTDQRQARRWAMMRARRRTGSAPGVIEIAVDRNEIAGLDVLAFVRREFSADDYWSFVDYCRRGATDHARSGSCGRYFDVVYGPFAVKWTQRSAASRGDQISFHTARAETILNASRRRRIL